MDQEGFPPIYRMARCRDCPLKCKPCLEVDEAMVIQEDERKGLRRPWLGNGLCQECHKKSVHSERANRRYDEKQQEEKFEDMTAEELLAQIEAMTAQIEALRSK